MPLDQRYKGSGRIHGGLVLLSGNAFPQDRSFIAALVSALDPLLGEDTLRGDAVMLLGRAALRATKCPARTEGVDAWYIRGLLRVAWVMAMVSSSMAV